MNRWRKIFFGLNMCHSSRPFLYSPSRGIRSSRPNAGFSARITQFRRLREPPGLVRRVSPTHASGYNLVYSRMRPPNGPIKGGTWPQQSVSPWTLELSTTLDLAETSVLDYYALARSPPRRQTILSFNWLSFLVRWARRPMPWLSPPALRYRHSQTQRNRLSQLNYRSGAPSIVRVYRVTPCRNRHACRRLVTPPCFRNRE